MYVVIIDEAVHSYCVSPSTATGIVLHHGRGMIAEVLSELQEKPAQRMPKRKPLTSTKPNKRRVMMNGKA